MIDIVHLKELKDCDRIGEEHDFAKVPRGDYICYFCHFRLSEYQRTIFPAKPMKLEDEKG